MAIYDRFNGIKIEIFGNEHLPPHFHAYYGEYEAVFEIRTLRLSAGYLPTRQRNRVLLWATPIIKNEMMEVFLLKNQQFRL